MFDKIDIVYLWVNGNDPLWRKKRQLHSCKYLTSKHWQYSNVEGRFRDNDELKYSLRSLVPYLEQIRNIFIVTDEQRPDWIEPSTGDRIKIVSHKELMSTDRPTYASSCIESYLHHIGGLSEHFLYFNDDIFLGRIKNSFKETFWKDRKTIICFEGSHDEYKHTDNERFVRSERSGLIIKSKLPNYRHKNSNFSHGMPFALRVSKLKEMEHLFPDAYHETRQLVFRKSGSPPLTSDTYFRWLHAQDETVEVNFPCRLINSGDKHLDKELGELIQNKDSIMSFCINDTLDNADDDHPNLAKTRSVLESLYPHPSLFEKKDL